ncbi:TonB-dependent receptor, partial [Bacteroidales bacterium OttesenSCG-928-E04]|nr:TonB-dependent receptor [Bacteroidales bacterium OttesenSCG-928-E04]
IENSYEPSLLPLLVAETPGLFITSRGIMGYGVSTGAAGGMKMRGIGGSPTAGVLVMIDGHPQYMGLMGHPMADAYHAMLADRVEIVRGPASILYGSNAMGGVINIITKKQKEDGIKTHLRAMYGSYNTLSVEGSNVIQKKKFNSVVSLSYNRSDNHRENMDFDQYNGYVKLGYDISKRWKVFGDFNITHFNASNPGTVDDPIIDNDAEITRGMASFSLENDYEKTSGALKFFYNFGMHDIDDGYRPDGDPRDYHFNSRDQMLGINLFQSYRFFKGNVTTAGFDYQLFGGKAWNRYSDRDEDIIDKSLNSIAGYLNMQQSLGKIVTANAGIRVDHNEHTGTEWIPQVGITVKASKSTLLKAIVSKGFRNPTIREMYMFPPQNPELEAERLMNYEISATQYVLDNKLSLSLNLFYINGDNMIQTTMVDGRPKNINTGKVENYGIEFASRYQVNKHLNLSANYSWLAMQYKIEGAPEHKLHVGASYARQKWGISTGIEYIHGLYSQISPDEIKENFILWNIKGSYRPVKFLEIFLKAENLLNQKYEINLGYPMPGITVFGGIGFNF